MKGMAMVTSFARIRQMTAMTTRRLRLGWPAGQR
jgi:hypothetical protein